MSTTLQTVAWGALAVGGLAGSAMCSGTETGLYTVNRVRLNVRAGRGDARARRMQHELERPHRMLSTLLVANTVFNYAGTIGVTALLTLAGLGEIAIVIVTALLVTPLLFIFAETLPKELFRSHANTLTLLLLPVVQAARLALTAVGILPLLSAVVWGLDRLTHEHTEEALSGARLRVASLLKEGAHHGLLSEAQTTLLDRALLMGSTTVADEMTPWPQVRKVRTGQDAEAIVRLLKRSPHSRFPLTGARGSVVGIVEHLDLALDPENDPAAAAATPVLVEPDMHVRAALVRMRNAHVRMAIVGTPETPLGIVTAKDLIEPLTGELAAW